MLLAKKYEIIEKIGGGRFGFVYKGINTKKNIHVAIKVESSSLTHILKNETTFLKYLYEEGEKRIPIVFWFGVIHSHTFLVMSYYECSLYDLYQRENVSVEKSKNFMKQAISILESIHSKYVLHRDIKPQNFMVCGDSLFLIDFGLATFWVNGEELPPGMVGTPKYVSFFIHKGESFGRKDDLISLGYVFLEWVGGTQILPWNCNGGEPRKNENYILLKSWDTLQPVCREINDICEKLLRVCYETNKNEIPNYGGLKEMIS